MNASYHNLNPVEQKIFIAELLHAVMNDARLFHIGQRMIDKGKRDGHFDGVTFMPEGWADESWPDNPNE